MSIVSLDDLPDFDEYHAYRCEPYIRAAMKLQAMEREAALGALASLPGYLIDDHKLFILCRMLFTLREGAKLHRLATGIYQFLGQTWELDWPSWPIQVVDGVPFLVSSGYRSMARLPETWGEFFGHCLSFGEWTTTRYRLPSCEDKKRALANLIASNKWHVPLKDYEVEHLAVQIQ